MAWGASTSKSARGVETVALTTSAQLIYTAPAYNGNVTSPSATARVTEMIVSNGNTSGTVTYTIYKVPNGGSPSSSNAVYNGIPFKNNPDTAVLSGLVTNLSAGDMIYALASTTGVNFTVSVDEYQ